MPLDLKVTTRFGAATKTSKPIKVCFRHHAQSCLVSSSPAFRVQRCITSLFIPLFILETVRTVITFLFLRYTYLQVTASSWNLCFQLKTRRIFSPRVSSLARFFKSIYMFVSFSSCEYLSSATLFTERLSFFFFTFPRYFTRIFPVLKSHGLFLGENDRKKCNPKRKYRAAIHK